MLHFISLLPEKSKRLLRNVFLDVRYGGFLGGTRKTPYAHLGVQDTANSDYEALGLIFDDAIADSDVLVDIGCGKGRVINWWLNRGFRNPMIGIELDPWVAQATHKRLRGYKNVRIICGDALANLPEDGTIFYLFNPFDKPWVMALKERLAIVFAKGGKRSIYYYNCVNLDVFENDADWNVEKRNLNSPHFHPLAVITFRSLAK